MLEKCGTCRHWDEWLHGVAAVTPTVAYARAGTCQRYPREETKGDTGRCGDWESRCIANVELRYHEPVQQVVWHGKYCGRSAKSQARKRGLQFVRRVREVVKLIKQEYEDPTRYAQEVAFHLLVMLDGMFEGGWDDEYRVQVKCGDTWENMEFSHHDL